MSCPVSRVLTDSLTHAIFIHENCFQNKSFLFLNPLGYLRVSNHWTISENPFIGQPSDRVHWANLQYNLLDNPPIQFIGQPSEYPFYSCTHTQFTRCTSAHAMIMSLHNMSCYMRTENYMQQLYSCFISSIILIYQASVYQHQYSHNLHVIQTSNNTQRDHQYQIRVSAEKSVPEL